MKTIKVILASSTLWMLGGCIAVPVGPGYYPEPPGYDQPAPAYYGPPAPRYYQPAPGYYGPPAYYGPSLGIGIYGGRGRYRGWR